MIHSEGDNLQLPHVDIAVQFQSLLAEFCRKTMAVATYTELRQKNKF